MEVLRENDYLVIPLTKSFTFTEAKVVRETILNNISSGARSFILDATELDFVDSRGIGMLVQILRSVTDVKGEFIIKNLNGNPLDLFRQTGLTGIFSIQSGEQVLKPRDNFFTDAVALKLEISSELVNEVAVLRFSGMMNSKDDALKFKREALFALADRKKLLLDLEELTYFDSFGASEILNIYKILRSSDGEMRVSGANDLVSDLLKTLSIEIVIPVFYDTAEALKGW